jgi:DNA-directed RNA polymerase alpha subunit
MDRASGRETESLRSHPPLGRAWAEGEGEMNEQHRIDPTAELPDNTPIEDVRFSTRLRNVLAVGGLKTVGEVRDTADKTLLSFQDLGPHSVTHLRKTLGLPSTGGVRPR